MGNGASGSSDTPAIQNDDLTAIGVALAGAVTVVASDGKYFDGYDALIGFLLVSVLVHCEPLNHLRETWRGRIFVSFAYALCLLLIFGAFFFTYNAIYNPDYFRNDDTVKISESIIFSWYSFPATIFLVMLSSIAFHLATSNRPIPSRVRELLRYLTRKLRASSR